MTQNPSFPYIAMAAPVYGYPRSFVFLPGLPHAVDELFNQMLRIFADSVGPGAMDPPFNQDHNHLASHSPHHHEPGTTLRTPKLSVLGFASLLLGISSTLMLFGLLAFFLGFMLMPLILPASIAVCVGASLTAFKEGRQPTPASSESLKNPASSESLKNRRIFDTKAWF